MYSLKILATRNAGCPTNKKLNGCGPITDLWNLDNSHDVHVHEVLSDFSNWA